jgi:glucuronokinase
LAGNPSDLYGGAVLAVPLRAFCAHVEVVDATEMRIVGDAEGRPLIDAAIARSVASDTAFELRWTSDIPRTVGLAGSSAIIVAALRALATRAGEELSDLDLALRAQSVEVDDLGFIAGLQDRAVQAADAPVLVEVAGAVPVVTRLQPAAPIRIAVAWYPSAAGSSVVYHSDLRQRVSGGAGENMAELASLARRAAVAFSAGDAAALAAFMAASARVRALVAPLSSDHERLARAVASAGLEPNSAGSGGAVAAVVSDEGRLAHMRAAVRDIGGDVVVETFG